MISAKRREEIGQQAAAYFDRDYRITLVEVISDPRQKYMGTILAAMEATRFLPSGVEVPDYPVRLSAAKILMALCGDEKPKDLNINGAIKITWEKQ